MFEDLQTVLRCCERLVSEFAGEADEVVVEAVWTTALLSYARCFTEHELANGVANKAANGDANGSGAALTEDDVSTTHANGDEVRKWHRLLLQLRDHYADPAVNPRERFSVGVSQGEDGTASGVAITSARQPLVDDLTVRQTGAIAYALSGLVNAQIEAEQQQLFANLMTRSKEDLDTLDPLEVVPATAAES